MSSTTIHFASRTSHGRSIERTRHWFPQLAHPYPNGDQRREVEGLKRHTYRVVGQSPAATCLVRMRRL